MDSKAPQQTAPRTAFALSLLLIMLGSCSVETSIAQLTGPIPDRIDLGEKNVDLQSIPRAILETAWDAPQRRPLAAAQGVVGAMMLVGWLLLTLRRNAAPWWITQACIAAALWSVAQTTTHIMTIRAQWTPLYNLAKRFAETLPKDQAGITPAMLLWESVAAVAITTGMRLALLAWIGWRVRRADIRGMLMPPSA
jgi:hypothetical protein